MATIRLTPELVGCLSEVTAVLPTQQQLRWFTSIVTVKVIFATANKQTENF